jgi:lipopolysaccharide export system permease protein
MYVVAILVTILVVIDFTEKSDDFIKNHLPFSVVFGDYYLNFMPYMANVFSPISVFIATVFVTARMATHTEIIAMLSSGISFKRILVPYVIGSSLLGILIFFMIGWVIPNANKTRISFENQYLHDKFYFEGHNVHMKIGPNSYIYLESYNSTIDVGYQFSLETFEGNELKSKLKSSKIAWNPKSNSWTLDVYSVRSYSGGKEHVVHGHNKDTLIDLSPKDFSNKNMLYETFTLTELNTYIQELKEKGAENIEAYVTEKYKRYAYPFAIVILTVIGVIASSVKSREGPGFSIAFGFLLAIIYILFTLISQSFSNVGSMGPMLAIWLPNIVFTIIGLIMYKRVPK